MIPAYAAKPLQHHNALTSLEKEYAVHLFKVSTKSKKCPWAQKVNSVLCRGTVQNCFDTSQLVAVNSPTC